MKTFNTWVTADLHFGHKNIMKFNPNTRQYTDVDHMDNMIVQGWNASVAENDLVYILGDVAFCNAQKATQFMRRCNGRKILIEGNHDHKNLQDAAFRAEFEEVHIYHEITHDSNKICLFHYPVLEWNQCHRGALHLFGHQHGNGGPMPCRSMDVGMDATGNIVTNMDDIVRTLLKKPMQGHH
jgi:calcineurin-like phosphoesterase family protein